MSEGVEPMGRGRAKAKQTKVARELKYFSPSTDLDALRAELTGTRPEEPPTDVAEDEADPYAPADEDEQRWG